MDMHKSLLISVVLFVPNLGFLSDSLFCYHCTAQSDINKCKTFISCQDSNEVCFFHRQHFGSGNVSHTAGCLAKTLCHQFSSADASGNCIQCCNSSLCNTQQPCNAVTTTATETTTATTTTTTTTTTTHRTTTASLPCVDNPNVDCKVVAPDVCGKDDHFTYHLCRRTCGGCGHHGN